MKTRASMVVGGVIRKWGYLGSLSMVDQCLFSGSNFLVNMLLARWLAPDAYGAFAVASSFYLMAAGVVCSLTLEPMMIYGSTDFAKQIHEYLKRISVLHMGISTVTAILLLVACLCVRGVAGEMLVGAAFGLPFMLQVWFVRRALYTQTRIGHAVVVSLLYAVFLLGGIVVLEATGLLYPFRIYQVFVLASLICILYYRLAALTPKTACASLASPAGQMLSKHWDYGKWLVVASIASSVSTLLYAPALGLLSQLQEAAALKAVRNFSLPLNQLLTALYLLMLPVVAKVLREASRVRARRYMLAIGSAFVGAAAFYGATVTIFGRALILIFYPDTLYIDYYWLIPVLALVSVITAINQFLAIVARVYERTRTILAAKISSAIAVLLVLGVAVPIMRLRGVMLGMCLGGLVELYVLVRAFGNPRRDSSRVTTV
jgi:O-antigen/teichoic acid export membrane protein